MPIVPSPPPPRSEPFVAVEFDVLDDQGNPVTLLLSNGGMATVMRNGLPYYPRLTNLPILLGSTITVTQYGSPVRAQPNAGVIQFRFDEGIWIWAAYRWIGRAFRVYEGQRSAPFATIVDVDADMFLVYAGRVAGFSHDCFTATVQTTDAGLDIDNPIVTDFYDVTFPVGIQGKPRPTVRGKFFSAQPVIVDETAQIYELQSLPQGLDSIDEVRVGGVPWIQAAAPPAPGQWSPLNVAGIFQRFQLGSPPLGQDVRVDGTAGSFTIGQLITAVVTDAGGLVDAVAMDALDTSTQLQQASLVTNTTPVNRLSAQDDFVTAGGCWWGFNPLEQATGAAISIPDAVGKYRLTEVEINTISLNTIQPLAWRLRIGSQRNWQPESSFDDAVLQTDIAKWSAPALVYEPHYENPNALTLEPRAVDVPLLVGTSPNPTDAANEQARLISAWGDDRTVFDVTVWMRPEDINLYDTVEVDFMMVTGLFRIVSAIRAIGGNGPATLQLWGIQGAVPPSPLPLPLPPAFIGPPPVLVPPPGGGQPPSFNPGQGVPTPLNVTISSASITIGILAGLAGTVLASLSTTTTTGDPFTGSYAISNGGLFAISGATIVLARDLQAGDQGNTFSAQVTAIENGGSAVANFSMQVVPGSQGVSGGAPSEPPPAPQIGWTITVTMAGPAAGAGSWTLLFSDPAIGSFMASFPVNGPGVTPLDIVQSWASQIQAQINNALTLFVVSDSGASSPDAGTAQLVVLQSPFTGNTTVVANNGGPGSVSVQPYP